MSRKFVAPIMSHQALQFLSHQALQLWILTETQYHHTGGSRGSMVTHTLIQRLIPTEYPRHLQQNLANVPAPRQNVPQEKNASSVQLVTPAVPLFPVLAQKKNVFLASTATSVLQEKRNVEGRITAARFLVRSAEQSPSQYAGRWPRMFAYQ